MKTFFKSLFVLLIAVSISHAKTLHVFAIGNSFSGNAAKFLPQIVKSAGDEIVLKRAEIGGAPLEKHWNGVAAYLADPNDEKGKIYGGKSLKELMGDTKWDIVTIQQYSMYSSNIETYQPFATKLRDYVKTLQPQAQIWMHQTWPYRVDSKDWGQVVKGQSAKNQNEMWEKSRAAYHQIAKELGVKIIPVGDAFQTVNTDPQWGFKPDATFDAKTAKAPTLPDQTHSLNVGYSWKNDKLGFDSHHASDAGCYLAGLAWYATLFDASPQKVTFAPPSIPTDFAAYLRKVAAETVQKLKAEN
jgi:hypothetical protein